MCTMAKPSQRALEPILRSTIPPGKRYILDLMVEDDAHLTEIAESISVDGQSFAQLLGVKPLKPENEDITTSQEDRYYTHKFCSTILLAKDLFFASNRYKTANFFMVSPAAR